MKRSIFAAVILSAAMFIGCGGPESRGEAAWKEAMRAPEGSALRLNKQKDAYMRFKQAYDKAAARGRVSEKLRNNYLRSAITRIEFFWDATLNPNTQAIRLIREDVENSLKNDNVLDEIRDAYANFLINVARHHFESGVITRAMETLETAKTFAADKAKVEAVKNEITANFTQEQLSTAQNFLAEARRSRQPLDFIRAEYFARLVLHFDSANAQARQILGTTRRETVQNLTAFEAAIEEYADTVLFRAINSDGALMSVQNVATARGRTTVGIELYNNSFAVIIPEANMFRLVLTDGNEITADEVVFDRRTLNQRHNVPGRLVFNRNIARNDIRKVVFYARLGDENAPPVTGNKYLR